MTEKLAITAAVDIEVAPDEVYRALIDPAQIVRFFPFDKVESEVAVGGQIVFRGLDEGGAFADWGVIEEMQPGLVFQYRYWSDNHGTPRTPENHLRIRYDLAPVYDGTRLTVTHSEITPGEHHEVMSQAWPILLHEMKDYLESGPLGGLDL